MAGISNYLADSINDWLHGGGTSFTPPSTTYFALMTILPVAAGGGTECSGGSYARVGYTNSSGNWPASVNATKESGAAINWGTLTASLGMVAGVAEYDASTGGNLLTFAPFTSGPIFIGAGSPFSISVDGGVYTEGLNISIYLANKLNDWLHGGGAYSVPSTTYFAFMLTNPAPSGSGGLEASGGNYARVAFANNSTNWPASSGQLKTNAVAINFGTMTSSLGTGNGIAEYDALTGGNLLTFGPLSPAVTVNAGQPFQIPPNGAVYQPS
jgi:hypothetical protein